MQLECEVDSLTTRVSEMETRIIEMEQRLSGNPPSSLITSTSAVEARDQFAIDNEELGRNVVTKLSNIPRDFAVKLCHRYLESGSEVGEHRCWVTSSSSMFQTMSSQRIHDG